MLHLGYTSMMTRLPGSCGAIMFVASSRYSAASGKIQKRRSSAMFFDSDAIPRRSTELLVRDCGVMPLQIVGQRRLPESRHLDRDERDVSRTYLHRSQ